jgi:hypothetical protein
MSSEFVAARKYQADIMLDVISGLRDATQRVCTDAQLPAQVYLTKELVVMQAMPLPK